MGYLSQKKKQANVKELLNVSLGVLFICCILLFGWRESLLAAEVSHWLFQIYIFIFMVGVYGVLNRFYWRASILFIGVLVLFFYIGMGSNIFFSTQTDGKQQLNLLFQSESQYLDDINLQINKQNVDVAGLRRSNSQNFSGYTGELNLSASIDDNNLMLTPHQILRSGEILLSSSGSAGFIDVQIKTNRLVLISLDLSKIPSSEQKTAFKNLAEFVNMQDFPVIVFGDFGVEAWAPIFLSFMEKTGLSVKNRIILSDGRYLLNPFNVPSINLLAYKDFGIDTIEFLKAKKNKNHPLLIKLNY